VVLGEVVPVIRVVLGEVGHWSQRVL
jgi:hypothetical protein